MLTKEQEMAAFNGEILPYGLSASNAVLYEAIRYISFQYRAKFISKEQAAEEKRRAYIAAEEQEKAHNFEIRCWENSAKRTLAACHAMVRFRKDRTLESADNLVNMLEWLEEEAVEQPEEREGELHCKICGFVVSGSDNFCRECGQKLKGVN